MNKSNHPQIDELERGGTFEGGMRSLVKGAQIAFLVLVLVILALLLRFATTEGYFAVKPQEAVIVLKFGKYAATFTKDSHWFLPYPVTRFIRIRTAPQTLTVDFRPAPQLQREMEGMTLIPGRDEYVLTRDSGILHPAWSILYHVSDPKKYYERCLTPTDPMEDDEVFRYSDHELLGTRGPQTMLRNCFRQAVVGVTARYTVDDIIFNVEKRNAYIAEVQSAFAALLVQADVGVSADTVLLDSVKPPAQTELAFNAVSLARSRQESMINDGNTYAANTANTVESEKAEIIASARAYSSQIVSEVQAESVYFESILKEYKNSPETVLMTLYNNTLREVLSAEDGKYILGTSSEGRELRIKLNPEAKRRPAANGGNN